MDLKVFGSINGNVIDKVEPGNIIVGYNGCSKMLDLSDFKQMETLSQELQNLKTQLSKEQGNEEACRNIDEAVTAIQNKDESTLKKALQSIGRECANVAEGVLGSMLASILMALHGKM